MAIPLLVSFLLFSSQVTSQTNDQASPMSKIGYTICANGKSTSMALTEKLDLKSSDGEMFNVDIAVAQESQIIKDMIEDGCAGDVIPLTNVKSNILSKVIEYCKKHVEMDNESMAISNELKAWDAKFVDVDQTTLFDLILAANYLNIKSLLNLTTQTVADMMKGRTVEEINKIFNIKDECTTSKEEEKVQMKNGRAFE